MPDLSPAQLTPEQREQLLVTMAKIGADLQAAVQQFLAAFGPTAQAIVQQFAELQSALHGAGLLDKDGRSVRPADRPAWQSPYGPPARR